MAEADDHFLVRDARADVLLRFVGRLVALLDLERDLVGAAVLRAAQRADGAGDRRVHVGAGAGDHARGERRGVELVLGVEDERGVHRVHPARVEGRLPCSRCRKWPPIESSSVSTSMRLPCVAEVIPVEQHRAEAREQPVGDVARAGRAVVVLLGQHAAERRHAGAQHVHRMRWRPEAVRARRAPPRASRAAAPASPCRRRARRGSAACRGSAGTRSPRTRSSSARSRMS